MLDSDRTPVLHTFSIHSTRTHTHSHTVWQRVPSAVPSPSLFTRTHTQHTHTHSTHYTLRLSRSGSVSLQCEVTLASGEKGRAVLMVDMKKAPVCSTPDTGCLDVPL